MSDRYQGGLITKTPVTPSGPYGTNTAPGIWTLEQQAYWQQQGLWPSSAGVRDPYFKNVTLLLNNNNTNGAQNNTFLDSSTNAFTLTRNGNTSQGTLSPYGNLWSNYFDGSSYLYTSSSSVFGTGTGNFTVEAWVLPTSLRAASGENNIIGNASTNGWLLGYFANSIYLASTNNGYTVQISYTLTIGAWSHIAAVRNGNTVTIYVNGTSIGSGTYTTNCPTGYCAIGGDGANGTARCMYGYISNARFNNTALYSSNFTPSTTPLTAVSGTQILSAQSNRFIDTGANAFSLSLVGTPTIQRLSPFAPTVAYSASTNGGSGYFDSSGDYLVGPTGSSAFDFTTGAFTVEAWVYQPATSIGTGGVVSYMVNDASQGWVLDTNVDVANRPGFYVYGATGTGPEASSILLKDNSWNHLAVSSNGTTITLYVNGVSGATANTNAPGSNGSAYLSIGAWSYSTKRAFNGNIGQVRVVKGVQVYTGTFTPPTLSPLATSGSASAASYPSTTNVNTSFSASSCSLLTNFTNGGFYDSAMLNAIETGDTSQVSTDVQKFSLATLKTTGATSGAQVQPSSLRLPRSTNWSFGTGDFTIEGWCYATSGLAADSAILCSELPSRNWLIQWQNGDYFRMQSAYAGAINLSSSGSTTFNTWYHFAMVRVSGTLYFYVNGTQTYSGAFAYDMNVVSGLQIGSHKSSSSDEVYMSQVRITKGVARYTSNFTPSTTTFPTY